MCHDKNTKSCHVVMLTGDMVHGAYCEADDGENVFQFEELLLFQNKQLRFVEKCR